jgi:hypothetical protein
MAEAVTTGRDGGGATAAAITVRSGIRGAGTAANIVSETRRFGSAPLRFGEIIAT